MCALLGAQTPRNVKLKIHEMTDEVSTEELPNCHSFEKIKTERKLNVKWHFSQHLWNTIETDRSFCSTSSPAHSLHMCARFAYVSSVLNICQSARWWRVRLWEIASRLRENPSSRKVHPPSVRFGFKIIINVPTWSKTEENNYHTRASHRIFFTHSRHRWILFLWVGNEKRLTKAQHQKRK